MYIGGDIDLVSLRGRFGAGASEPLQTATASEDLLPGNWLVSSDSQLFQRADLAEQIGGLRFSPESSDSTLILAAYQKWGPDCVRRLAGEFSFAIWDPVKRHLFCGRDHVASRPFYYFVSGSRIVFGGDPAWILSRPDIARLPNLQKIAAWGVPGGKSQLADQTFHKGILALPGGTTFVASRSGVQMQRYWDLEVCSGLVPDREDDALEMLRSLVVKSVEDRISGFDSVGAFLSGGLDSSSLVAVAAKQLHPGGRTLHAISGVLPPNQQGPVEDEREYIDEFKGWPGVRISYVTPPADSGPFDDLDDPALFARTFNVTSRNYLYESMQRVAVAEGLDLILDGCGGECGPTAHNRIYYLELAVSGSWLQLRRELSRLKEVEGVSPLREIGGHVLNLIFPLRNQQPVALLNPQFVREYALKVRPARVWPDHRLAQIARAREYLARKSSNIGARRRVRHSYPLLDRRILEFCASAPGSLKVKDGQHRLLMRRAMEGILPPRIQWRRTKAPFSPDYQKRYNAQLQFLRPWLARITAHDPVRRIVDIEALLQRTNAAHSGGSDSDALVTIPATVYMIQFLRQFADFRV